MRYSLSNLYRQINRNYSIKTDNELDINSFVGERETNISEYIESFVNYHKGRLSFKNKFQYIITIFLLILILGFGATLIASIVLVINGTIVDATQIATILSCSGASFIASVFSLLQIIVKYLFPQSDDKVGTDLLKTTLSSDLELLNYLLNKEKTKTEIKELKQSDIKEKPSPKSKSSK